MRFNDVTVSNNFDHIHLTDHNIKIKKNGSFCNSLYFAETKCIYQCNIR